MPQHTEDLITGLWATRDVFIGHNLLPPFQSQKVYNHSPDGFSWAYGGSGPAQLALALMLTFASDEREALAAYQQFKWEIVATLPQADFELPVQKVLDWLDSWRVSNGREASVGCESPTGSDGLHFQGHPINDDGEIE